MHCGRSGGRRGSPWGHERGYIEYANTSGLGLPIWLFWGLAASYRSATWVHERRGLKHAGNAGVGVQSAGVPSGCCVADAVGSFARLACRRLVCRRRVRGRWCVVGYLSNNSFIPIRGVLRDVM